MRYSRVSILKQFKLMPWQLDRLIRTDTIPKPEKVNRLFVYDDEFVENLKKYLAQRPTVHELELRIGA